MKSPLQNLMRHPIVLAPMAGGPSTPALCAAVSEAGGFGQLGCAYLQPDAIRAALAEVRRLTLRPFAASLFVPSPPPDESRLEEAQALLEPVRRELGLAPRAAPPPQIDFGAQLEAVLEGQPAVCSFTFGVPAPEVIAALRARGIAVWGTATHVAEARALQDAGVDAICAQGAEAGGHRGTFIGRAEDALVGTLALVPQVVDAVQVPVIAAGGIADGRGVAAALCLGAQAAQLGTAFLRAAECGSDAAYRGELSRSTDVSTVITRAFSGRAARGLRNRFTEEWRDRETAPFPLQNLLTQELRAAARKAGRPELVNLWAGQASALARPLPAADVVAQLVQELEAARNAL